MKTILIQSFAMTLFSFIMTGCLGDEEIKLKYESYTPQQQDDGWVISTPHDEGFDSEKIDQVYRDFFSTYKYPTMRTLIIVRNSSIVAEGYCRDENDRTNYHDLKSATKGITALLAGIAIDKGLIDSLKVPLYPYLSQYFDKDTRKREITLYHALTMQTGLLHDNEKDPEFYYNAGSSLEYALSRPLYSTPGLEYYYQDCNPQLVSGLIHVISGKTLEKFAADNLFSPLDITHYQWEEAIDGINFGAFGLWLIPRDMAKIGQLMLQEGSWNGTQIVSKEWIEEATRLQVPEERYGLYWRIYDENNIFQAQGHGGQFILVVRELNLVIILTADPYSREWVLSEGYSKLLNDIIAAIVD